MSKKFFSELGQDYNFLDGGLKLILNLIRFFSSTSECEVMGEIIFLRSAGTPKS